MKKLSLIFYILFQITLNTFSQNNQDPRFSKEEIIHLREGEEIVLFEQDPISGFNGELYELITKYNGKYYIHYKDIPTIGPLNKCPFPVTLVDKNASLNLENKQIYLTNNPLFSPEVPLRKKTKLKETQIYMNQVLNLHSTILKNDSSSTLVHHKTGKTYGPYQSINLIETDENNLVFSYKEKGLFYFFVNDKIMGGYKNSPYPRHFDSELKQLFYVFEKDSINYIKDGHKDLKIGSVTKFLIAKNKFVDKTNSHYAFTINTSSNSTLLKAYLLKAHQFIEVNSSEDVYIKKFSDEKTLKMIRNPNFQNAHPDRFLIHYDKMKLDLVLFKHYSVGHQFIKIPLVRTEKQFALVVQKKGFKIRSREDFFKINKYVLHNGQLHGPYAWGNNLQFIDEDLYYFTRDAVYKNHKMIFQGKTTNFALIEDQKHLTLNRTRNGYDVIKQDSVLFSTKMDSLSFGTLSTVENSDAVNLKYTINNKQFCYNFNSNTTSGPLTSDSQPKLSFSKNGNFFGYQSSSSAIYDENFDIYINGQNFGKGFLFRNHPNTNYFAWISHVGKKVFLNKYQTD